MGHIQLNISPSCHTLFEAIKTTLDQGIPRKISVDELDVTGFRQVSSKLESLYITEDVVIIDPTLLVDPSITAGMLKFLVLIASQLRLNNALWSSQAADTDKTNVRRYISELKKRSILWATETPTIYLVNPKYIRKGSLKGVLAMTMHEVSTVSKVSAANIRPLRAKKVDFNLYHFLTTLPPNK